MRCTIGRENSQVDVADIGKMGITGGEAGEIGVVLEVADEGVLVVVVHVGDDALLRYCIGVFGAILRHRAYRFRDCG